MLQLLRIAFTRPCLSLSRKVGHCPVEWQARLRFHAQRGCARTQAAEAAAKRLAALKMALDLGALTQEQYDAAAAGIGGAGAWH